MGHQGDTKILPAQPGQPVALFTYFRQASREIDEFRRPAALVNSQNRVVLGQLPPGCCKRPSAARFQYTEVGIGWAAPGLGGRVPRRVQTKIEIRYWMA